MLKSVFGSIRGRTPGDFRWSSHGVFRNHFRWLTVGCLTCNSSNMGAKNVSNSVLRVGQFVAYHGDRADGMRELLDAGVDILTGDYLAELTMLVLRKNQLRGGPGYAAAFVEQLEQFLPQIAKDGVKVVTNAGGLDPAAVRPQFVTHARVAVSNCRWRGSKVTIFAKISRQFSGPRAHSEILTPVTTCPSKTPRYLQPMRISERGQSCPHSRRARTS